MKKFLKQILAVVSITGILVVPHFVFAQEILNKLQGVGSGEQGPYSEANEFNLSVIIGIVINAFLSLLGIIFVILMLIAGYHWMTANGEEQKISDAKDTIKAAIIGLIIVVGSYAIWNFISKIL